MSFGRPAFEACWLKPAENSDTPYFEWECDGCGGGYKFTFPPNTPVKELWTAYVEHLATSHGMKPKCGFSDEVRVSGSMVIEGRLECTLDEGHFPQSQHDLKWTQFK